MDRPGINHELNMRVHPPLLIATTNPGKVRELSELFSGLAVRLRSLSDFPNLPEVEETGATFEENAIIKVGTYSKLTGSWTLADDSGLEVEALGGAPGVYSARYGGKDASYSERMARLLSELEATGDHARRARFVCVIALANPVGEEIQTFTGECKGTIAYSPRGSGGFGYDPIFVPEGYTQTFGEMSSNAKQHLSHRARAAVKTYDFLRTTFASIT